MEELLKRFVSALGLAEGAWEAVQEKQLFLSPAGLACRVHVCTAPAGLRPEVVLPMAIAELDAGGLRRLLTMQAFLLTEWGWYLGPDDEGLCSLSVVPWSDDPEGAARVLDFANLIARDVLAALLGFEPGCSRAR